MAPSFPKGLPAPSPELCPPAGAASLPLLHPQDLWGILVQAYEHRAASQLGKGPVPPPSFASGSDKQPFPAMLSEAPPPLSPVPLHSLLGRLLPFPFQNQLVAPGLHPGIASEQHPTIDAKFKSRKKCWLRAAQSQERAPGEWVVTGRGTTGILGCDLF